MIQLDELWNRKDVLNNVLNYSKEELIEAFNNIFGKEQVSNLKIVGFKIKVINQLVNITYKYYRYDFTISFIFCCRSYDICSCRRIDIRITKWRTF